MVRLHRIRLTIAGFWKKHRAIGIRRFAAGAWDLFRDNFVVLAVVIAAIWLLAVWVAYLRHNIKLEEFSAYSLFGAAFATLLLAVGAAMSIRDAKASRMLNETMIEENRKLAESPRIGELIIKTIDPLQDSLNDRYEEAQEYYLYDIPMPFLIAEDVMSSPPRTPRDWGIRMIDKGTRYADLERLYPQICIDIQACEKALRELMSKLHNILDKIDTRLRDPQLAKIVGEFPPNTRIPLRYLPFWELLKRVGKTMPHPGYDRYKLWSEEVDSFWQRNVDSVTQVISSDQEIMQELDSLTHLLDNLEMTYSKAYMGLTAARNELKVKYNLTDQELERIKAFWETY